MTAIKKQLTVEAPIERAFSVFTAQINSWWPRMMKIGATAMVECVLEPRAGGRWYEVGEDGAQCDWGKVLAWDPPNRVLLDWQISAQWKFDPDVHTEVEVTFTELGPRRTRVDFEHRGLDKIGAQIDGPMGMDAGWSMILGLFDKAAAG
jgi:uncharacterized protein YndB with AHSA1/START domain